MVCAVYDISPVFRLTERSVNLKNHMQNPYYLSKNIIIFNEHHLNTADDTVACTLKTWPESITIRLKIRRLSRLLCVRELRWKMALSKMQELSRPATIFAGREYVEIIAGHFTYPILSQAVRRRREYRRPYFSV
jgi:hypothetical protein